MKIVISKKGKTVSLYEVEKFFQENKNKQVVNIADELSLARFRLGVKQKEIKPFTIIVKDIDNTLITEVCSENGKLCKVWNTEILRTFERILFKIM